MRKNLLILAISLVLPMYCSSQTIFPKIVQDSLIVITPQQLKITNLIFLEHRKLLAENKELYSKLDLQDKLLSKYESNITTLNSVVVNYKELNNINKELLLSKDKEISRYKRKVISIGIVSVAITSIILCLTM